MVLVGFVFAQELLGSSVWVLTGLYLMIISKIFHISLCALI